jgi:type VI secretion system protein ImpH
MADTDGKTADSLIEKLAQEPYGFDFFRAVRLVENQRRDLPRVGASQSPAEDPVRFCQNPSLIFAPAALEAWRTEAGAPVPKLFLSFFGLCGPNGPLPPHITEYAHERQLNYGDRTIPAFLNIFNHRLASFFYRAWAVNQQAVDLDRPEDQHFAKFIGSFLGIGMESLQGQDPVPDGAKLFFAGRLAAQTRNAEGLEALLQDYFDVKSELMTFFGQWIELPPDSICRLGESPESGSLGMTAILGSRIWDCQLGFRIRLGPMKLADYERMLPCTESFERLQCWVTNYCGEQFTWDMQLVLEAAEVPDTCLGRAGRLGWTTWAKTRPLDHDADECIHVGSEL